MSASTTANAVRPSRRRVLSVLGGAAVLAVPEVSQSHQLRQLFEAFDGLEREVDQACDASMEAPLDTPAYELARMDLDRLIGLRDRAFEAVAAAPATNREDIERKVAIFREWTREYYHDRDLWTVMLDSALRDLGVVR